MRHLCEPLGGTEGLIETAGFKKATERMWQRTSSNVNREWVPNWGRSNAETKQTLCGHEEPTTDWCWKSVENVPGCG